MLCYVKGQLQLLLLPLLHSDTHAAPGTAKDDPSHPLPLPSPVGRPSFVTTPPYASPPRPSSPPDRQQVGDVVVAVDGVPVKGKKVTSAMSETATGFKLTVVRYKTEAQAKLQAGGDAEAVVDMEGYLYQAGL